MDAAVVRKGKVRMQLSAEFFKIHKKIPLTISRGTVASSANLWIKVESDGVQGWGEASPFNLKSGSSDEPDLMSEFHKACRLLENFSAFDHLKINRALSIAKVHSSVRAGIDMALYDWLGKKAGLPVFRLLGMEVGDLAPLSFTVGIGSQQDIEKRLELWNSIANPSLFKVKLGSKEGIEHDKKSILLMRNYVGDTPLCVDANCAWSLEDSILMSEFLADQNVLFVEQPLATENDHQLSHLKERSPLPIIVDESCFDTRDVIRLAPHVDGINIKVMKAGGLTEALHMIHIAKQYGLKVMFGCYSDSSLSNTAMVHLGGLVDFLDLDSHLNLVDDPFVGARLEGEGLVPNSKEGLGVLRCI